MAHRPRVRVALAKWLGKPVKTKSAAVEAYDLLKQDLRDGTFKPEGRGVVTTGTPSALTLQVLIDSYEKDHVLAKQQRTAGDYDYRVKPLLDFFGSHTPVDSLTSARIQELQAHLRQPRIFKGEFDPRAPSKAYVNRPVALLRSLLLWAVERKLITSRPKFTFDKEDYTRWERVSPVRESRLLNAAPPRLQALIVVALDTGMRQGEMLKLRVGDVDLTAGTITPTGATTKDGKHRVIPIGTHRLKDTLEWFIGDKGVTPQAPLIDNGYGGGLTDLSRAWETCRLKAFGYPLARDGRGNLALHSRQALRSVNLHWHDLRHEFACRLDDRGVALGVIQRLLGHADIKTTERYLRRGAKELAEGAAKLEDGTSVCVNLPALTNKCKQVDRLNVSQKPTVKSITGRMCIAQ